MKNYILTLKITILTKSPFSLNLNVNLSFQDIESEGPEPSDWDKYAAEEYEILVAEETANEQLHEGYTLSHIHINS